LGAHSSLLTLTNTWIFIKCLSARLHGRFKLTKGVFLTEEILIIVA
jgi:hypothetical protein